MSLFWNTLFCTLPASTTQTDFSLQEVWNREVTAPRFSGKPQKKKLLGMHKQWILWRRSSFIRSKRHVHIERGSKIALEEFLCGCTCLAFSPDWFWQEVHETLQRMAVCHRVLANVAKIGFVNQRSLSHHFSLFKRALPLMDTSDEPKGISESSTWNCQVKKQQENTTSSSRM